MLKELIEDKLPTDFISILDTENGEGSDLFSAFLHAYATENSKKICVFCYENPVEYYLKSTESDNVLAFNIFNDPVGWNDSSKTDFDLKLFRSKNPDSSKTTFFIDSLSFLIMNYGLYTIVKHLAFLKSSVEKVICLVHADVISPNDLESLKFLSSTSIRILKNSLTNTKSKVVELHHKKSGGKIIIHREVIFISADFGISSQAEEKISKSMYDVKEEMKSLTTFELGLEMSDNERKRKKQLILPYLRNKEENLSSGSIFYNQEPEDDPDDDLDI